MRSHTLCVCGHPEMYHVVPGELAEETGRECFPPEETDDLETGEEFIFPAGCDCENFSVAADGVFAIAEGGGVGEQGSSAVDASKGGGATPLGQGDSSTSSGTVASDSECPDHPEVKR